MIHYETAIIRRISDLAAKKPFVNQDLICKRILVTLALSCIFNISHQSLL